MKKVVLGVNIDDINTEETVSVVDGWLSGLKKHYIVTPNPEFLVTAQKDPNFKKILNDADLAIPDGVGLRIAGVKNTVAGTDLMERLAGLAAKKSYSIGLLGGRDGVAVKTAKRLTARYPGLKISYVQSEPVITRNGCDILFVAFGYPKQEKWIAENLNNIPVKVAMGVGGAFDYLSGRVPRAPKWMRISGLEWLFRLAVQPWRIRRQIKLIKFLTSIFQERIFGH